LEKCTGKPTQKVQRELPGRETSFLGSNMKTKKKKKNQKKIFEDAVGFFF
jgi:hypothetical protein